MTRLALLLTLAASTMEGRSNPHRRIKGLAHAFGPIGTARRWWWLPSALAALSIAGCCSCPPKPCDRYRVAHVQWNPEPTTFVAEVNEWGEIVRVDTLPGVWRPQ